MDEYYRAVRQLPSWLAQPLGQLPTPTAAQIHELRFRTGHGIFLTMSGRQVCLKELSECPQSLRECILDQLQLEEIFHTLCGGAVHAHQNELTQGFLTTPSGCRVGVAGRYVDRDGQMILQQVQSLNLRIARAVPLMLPDRLCEILQRHFIGMLVVVKPVARPAATSAPAAPATPVVKPAAASTGKSGVKSPLPGVILDIKVNVGDTVKKGQVIIILEAMKMENNINADKDGKITAINVNKGDSVLEGTDLVIIE